jgi:hypothetical protein
VSISGTPRGGRRPSSGPFGLDLEEARAKIDAVRERLQADLDGGAEHEAAPPLLARLERRSADVARVEKVLEKRATAR